MWASAHRGHSGGTRAERGSSLQTPKALTVRSSVLLLSTLAGEHNKTRQYDTGFLAAIAAVSATQICHLAASCC